MNLLKKELHGGFEKKLSVLSANAWQVDVWHAPLLELHCG